MKTQFRKLWDSLHSSYWFIPLVMMVSSVLLWRGTITLDHILSLKDKKAIAWLYIGNADTMRELLLTTAVAIGGIIGVVFTIIMVPLSIAATQFGPRLLRTFLRDLGTQITLGTFNATFIFCMAMLLQLSGAAKQPLPQISVNVALLLGIISFGILIYFINHVAVSLQAPIVIFKVSKELKTAINREFPVNSDVITVSTSKGNNEITPDLSTTNSVVEAKGSGYLQARDDDFLFRFAEKHNCILKLLSEPGDFITQGAPIVIAYPALNTESATRILNTAFILGHQRTLVQDVVFGINELVEVAIRALSPAINDPFTAMTSIDWIGSSLCQICSRRFPSSELFDKTGHLRIIRNPVNFHRLTDASFNQIREYGRGSRAVSLRLLDSIKTVALCAKSIEQREALLHHATLIENDCHVGLPDLNDRSDITKRYQEVKKVLNI